MPFSYARFVVGEREIGVITLPVPDQRPFYLNDSFGRVEKHVVYIRRGSATGVATPDEILKMGANNITPTGQPVLEIQLCDAESHVKFGTAIEVHPALVELPDLDALPCYGKPQYMGGGGFSLPTGSYDNNDFYADAAEYLKDRFKFCPIAVAVTNSATTSAEAVLVTMELSSLSAAHLAGEDDLPTSPSRSSIGINPRLLSRASSRQISVEDYDAVQEVRINIGEVHAGRTEYSKESFYITAEEAGTVSMKVTISAKNLRIPVTSSIAIDIIPRPVKCSADEIIKFSKTLS